MMDPELERIFKKLAANVQQWIRLLFTRKEEALKGVGSHGTCNCPLARAFDVEAKVIWDKLYSSDKEKLIAAGFTREIYEEGIPWYDEGVNYGHKTLACLEREVLLGKFLQSDQLPDPEPEVALAQ
jgi:hypothetical protein